MKGSRFIIIQFLDENNFRRTFIGKCLIFWIFEGAKAFNFDFCRYRKANKIFATKGFFPDEWFDLPEKGNKTQLPPYEAFFSKLRNNNLLELHYLDFQTLIDGGMTSKKALSKLKWSQPSPTGHENYQNLISARWQEKMCSFKAFLRWYNNKGVVPALQAMQKLVKFHHKKGIDVLKHGCTLPNNSKFCLQKLSSTKFYTLRERGNDLLEKKRENMDGVPSIVFKRKAVLDKTLIRDSKNRCKKNVGNVVSRLYLLSMCQAMGSALFTQDWSHLK